jgi:hypothetical protein
VFLKGSYSFQTSMSDWTSVLLQCLAQSITAWGVFQRPRSKNSFTPAAKSAPQRALQSCATLFDQATWAEFFSFEQCLKPCAVPLYCSVDRDCDRPYNHLSTFWTLHMCLL